MTSSDKTTYQDLSSTSAAGVNALLDAKTDSSKADLQRRLNDAIRSSAPAIGQYWPGQGGIYAGIIRDGDRQWHLILAAADLAYIEAEWGKYGVTIKGKFSRHDGQHNTQLILAAESKNEIANYITALEIEGHRDFYWAAQFEKNLLRINLPEHLSTDWHWSSTQYSADDAWVQDFEDGYTYINLKVSKRAARAVRRLPIE